MVLYMVISSYRGSRVVVRTTQLSQEKIKDYQQRSAIRIEKEHHKAPGRQEWKVVYASEYNV